MCFMSSSNILVCRDVIGGAVTLEEVNTAQLTVSELTSPELKRHLIQFAVVHKTHNCS